MNERLIVSTECPTCGASLDFGEGSNAIQCLHCRSNLLVTGRKQVLSYFIAPKLDIHRAVAKVMIAHKQQGLSCRVIDPQLYFIPYYRMTGQDFLWEKSIPEPKSEPVSLGAASSDLSMEFEWGSMARAPGNSISLLALIINGLTALVQMCVEKYRVKKAVPVVQDFSQERLQRFMKQSQPQPPKMAYPKFEKKETEIQFQDRYVEKNFLACDLQGLDLYSLGIRPSVLKLELFRRATLEGMGKVVSVSITPEDAWLHGMKAADPQAIIYRGVVGRVLSIIYFPFWVVEVERQGEKRLTILDAVSEAVIKADAPLSIHAVLDHALMSDPQTIGFRPLTCPNCGWDFPVKPDDVVFFCSSCDKAWQIQGSYLYEISYQIAGLPGPDDQNGRKYLPLWVLQAQRQDNSAQKFFVPAFRYRRLKHLNDLAMHISRKQPSYSALNGERPEMHGCYYDQEDAVTLAQFINMGLAFKRVENERVFQEEKLSVTQTELTWFPFKVQGHSLTDPFTNQPLFQNLLL
jgi:DNA-directed RNA polymerase subunit RPC12/RpoP